MFPNINFPISRSIPTILATLEQNGYQQPTPIQDKIIPHILNGRDVVGLANTGTGKTAAFLSRLSIKIVGDKEQANPHPGSDPRTGAPNRPGIPRLLQRASAFIPWSASAAPISIVQIRELRYWNDLVIGTPGRIIDLINRKCLKLDQVETVVLDEADQMLDMGFMNDIRLIMSHVPAERHTLCFAATMSPTIEALIKNFLKDPDNHLRENSGYFQKCRAGYREDARLG